MQVAVSPDIMTQRPAPQTRYTLRRITASITKGLVFGLVPAALQVIVFYVKARPTSYNCG